MKVRKKILKTAAKIYAANLVLNSFGSGADSELLNNEEERDYMMKELETIANKIMPDITAATLDDSISEALKISKQ